ncbi:MAG: PKD domain-containing protein [Candidatus Limnocylindrales bacterium]
MNRPFRPGVRRRRSMRAAVALCVAGLTALVLGPATALAATSSLSSPTSLSGDSTLASVPFTASGAGVTATGSADISVHWSQPTSLGTTFDPNLVRQGRALNPGDSYTRTPTGTVTVDYTLNNLQVKWDGIGPLSLGSPTFSITGPCDLKAGGSSYVCNLSSSQIGLIPVFYGYIGPYVNLSLVAAVTVTPQGIATLRTATFGGNPGGTASLTLGESPITDSLSIPCTVGAGDELIYGLGGLSTTPGVSVDTGLAFDVGAALPDPIVPFLEDTVSAYTETDDLGTSAGTIAMTGSGATFDLGAVQANNIPPVSNAGGPYAGNEGSPISFDGSGSSSICGFPTLQWNFSDGGVAYGESPQHSFQGPGVYSGLLTATDATGLVSTTTFSVTIANLPPVVNAGPNVGAAWGQPVALNGSAVDPGANDQSTLSYSWNFGDGSPSASGGPSVSHSYSTPGSYTATLTSCDQWGACSSAATTVTIRTRAVTASYVGATSGTFDTPGILRASLTDEFGQAVAGRSVSFSVNGSPAGSSTTGAGGTASLAYTPELGAGAYATGVSFAGDSLYNAASASGAITVVQKATSVTYTGAVSGGPNKTVTLSAVLTDATGKAIAGKSITFVLGSQTVTATTNAAGVASTTLKLAQHNGKYALTATYAPTVTDAAFYVGSAASTTFTIGK